MVEDSVSPAPAGRCLRDLARTVATYDFFPEFSARVRRLVYHPLGVIDLLHDKGGPMRPLTRDWFTPL
jgi:hypothetical protein